MKLYFVIPAVNCLEMSKQTVESIKNSQLPFSTSIIFIDNGSDDGTKEWAHDMLVAPVIRDRFIYLRNDPRHGVAQSWNEGIKEAFKDPECEYVAVLNNDIYLHPKTIKHMVTFMDKTHYLMVTADNIQSRMSKEVMLQMELPEEFTDFDTWKIGDWRAEGPDFSCFLINRETIRVIGWFDENFKGAYCEDQDYHARSAMARRHAKQHNDQGLDPEFIHFKRLSTAPYFHYSSQTIRQNPQLAQEIMNQQGKNQEYYRTKFGAEHAQVMDGGGFDQPFGIAGKNWRDW